MAEQEVIDRLTSFYREADHALGSINSGWIPPARQATPRASWRVQVLAATGVLVFGIVVAVMLQYGRLHSTIRPAASASPTSSPSASASPTAPMLNLPAVDLTRAHLSNVAALITPFQLKAVDRGYSITLLAAYADPARTVLIFHVDPNAAVQDVTVDDGQGVLQSSSSAYGGAPGDSVYSLDTGPHAQADGLAHLNLQIPRLLAIPRTGASYVTGSWNFSLALKVQASIPLPAPAKFQIGSWTGNLEVLELTPSVIHLQAVLHGPSIPDIGLSTIAFVDPLGKVTPLGCGASITVPKLQLNASNYKNTRIFCYVERPAAGGRYQIRFQGGGGRYTIRLDLPPLAISG